MKGKVKCTCGWSWNKSDSSAKDMYICHECGRDNSNNMKNGGWLDNYNDSQASAPEGFQGDGYSNVGRNYSPAWGGQFQGGGKATRADSLALYNNSLQKEKFYKNNKDYKLYSSFEKNKEGMDFKDPKLIKKLISEIKQQNIKAIPFPGGTNYMGELYNEAKKRTKQITTNTYSAPDFAHGKVDYYYNPKAPKILISDKIKPQDSKTYISNAELSDVSTIPYYDPLAVKPFDLLTDAEKKLRVEKYGTSGVPKSYLDKIKPPDKQDKTDKQRPKVEALQPLTQQGVVSDFNVTAQLPVIRPEARIPKSFDITSQRQTMSGPSEYYNYNQKGLSIEQAVEAKRAADAYNQSIQDKYGNSKNPKAQERLKQLMQDVELTPNYQMGGSVYPVNYVPQAQDGYQMGTYFDEDAREKEPNMMEETYDDYNTGMTGMMKSKMATQAALGNPGAKRMMSNMPAKYIFTGNERFSDGTPAEGAGAYGSHYISNRDNYVYPNLQDNGEGTLNFIPNASPSDREAMRFENPGEADYFANHYKEVAPMMKHYFNKLAMGGSIPGTPGFTYARTNDPAPSEGPYAKKTLPSAKDGGWLDEYDKAKEGEKIKIKDERQDANAVHDNVRQLSFREKRGNKLLIKETENAKKDKQELQTTGKIKNPKSIQYKKLAPKQSDLKTQTKSDEELEGQLGFERPLVYLANPEKLLGDLGVPGMETSELDRQAVMANRFNPNQSRLDRFTNNANIGLGYVPEAAVNTAMAAAFMPEGSGALGLMNEALNPLAGLSTSIAPELRQGIRANGFLDMFKSKPKFNSEIDWSKWNVEIPNNTQLMKEYDAIEQASKANGTWMKNADGSAFKGTPEQFVQQNSESFKKAFGNSKLINPDGSPTIQYHGSAKNFDTFDESKFQLGDAGYSGSGIYTTPDKGKASSYALSSKSIHSGEYQPTVYELYGQGNNPISAEDLIKQNKDYDLFNFHRAKNWQGDVPLEQQMLNYDVAIRNQTKGIERISPWNQATELVFPTNKQLKSAIGNNGMFDMTNPNIYKAIVPGAIGLGAASQLEQKKEGGIIKDDMGYWNPKNWDSPVEIGSNEITMQDVPFDVLGISDEGDTQYMKANNPKNYKYKGKKVTEFRMAKNGMRQEQKGLVNLDQLTNFTNYNTKQPGGWLDTL